MGFEISPTRTRSIHHRSWIRVSLVRRGTFSRNPKISELGTFDEPWILPTGQRGFRIPPRYQSPLRPGTSELPDFHSFRSPVVSRMFPHTWRVLDRSCSVSRVRNRPSEVVSVESREFLPSNTSDPFVVSVRSPESSQVVSAFVRHFAIVSFVDLAKPWMVYRGIIRW